MAQKAVVNSATDLPLDKARCVSLDSTDISWFVELVCRWITLKTIDWTDQEGKSVCNNVWRSVVLIGVRGHGRWRNARRVGLRVSTVCLLFHKFYNVLKDKRGLLAVAILAILNTPNRPPSTIIIEQFRPPVSAYVIELPAGLIDANESAESTAFRELEEETGYKADKVLEVSPLMVCDPGVSFSLSLLLCSMVGIRLGLTVGLGMSSANMKLIVLNVPVSESETGPDGRPRSPKQKLEQGEHIVRRVIELPNLKAELEGALHFAGMI